MLLRRQINEHQSLAELAAPAVEVRPFAVPVYMRADRLIRPLSIAFGAALSTVLLLARMMKTSILRNLSISLPL